MSINEILEPHRKEICEVASRHGVMRLRVFGSVGRGDARADSDIDLLVDLAPDRSLLDVIAVKQDLEDMLGRRVDVLTPMAISPYLREQVLREAVPF